MATLGIINLSYRPGGMDVLGRSLAVQTSADYELTIVDDYPGRVERGLVAANLKDLAVPLYWHGPSKPKTRLGQYGIANAMNTGLLHCRSKYVLFIHDYTAIPYNAVEDWITILSGGDQVVSGWAHVFSAPKPERHADWFTWSAATTKFDMRFPCRT